MAAQKKERREGRMIHIRIPDKTHRRLRIHVAELDTTIQEWVASLIDHKLKAKKG